MLAADAKKFCMSLYEQEEIPLTSIADVCNIPIKNLRRWDKVGCIRKKGCGRKNKDPEMDQKVLKWYDEISKLKRKPTGSEIRKFALKVCKDKTFIASKGWLEKFKKKYHIELYRVKQLKAKKELSG